MQYSQPPNLRSIVLC